MNFKKSLEKIIKNNEVLRISRRSNNIRVLFNERYLDTFPIRVMILKVGDKKSLIAIMNNKIFESGYKFEEVDIILDHSKKNNLNSINLRVDGLNYLVEEAEKNDIEITIYLKNDDVSNFINVEYNLINCENNISYICGKYDKLYEKFISSKIKYMFSEMFVKMEELKNE